MPVEEIKSYTNRIPNSKEALVAEVNKINKIYNSDDGWSVIGKPSIKVSDDKKEIIFSVQLKKIKTKSMTGR